MENKQKKSSFILAKPWIGNYSSPARRPTALGQWAIGSRKTIPALLLAAIPKAVGAMVGVLRSKASLDFASTVRPIGRYASFDVGEDGEIHSSRKMT